MGNTTVERLSVLETKVEELSTQSHNLEKKVDTLIEIVSTGNFDNRIAKLEKKDNTKWIQGLIYMILGSVLTFLTVNFLQHNTI